jgi:hypothetical protein
MTPNTCNLNLKPNQTTAADLWEPGTQASMKSLFRLPQAAEFKR